jgi:hypothetical protein
VIETKTLTATVAEKLGQLIVAEGARTRETIIQRLSQQSKNDA